MKIEEITSITNDPDNPYLHFPGEFVYGSSPIMKDKSDLEEIMRSCSWDCFSAVGTIINEEDIDPLKKEFNTYLGEYIEKCIENEMPEEDISSLIIYKINETYYAFILYMYEAEYAICCFDNIGYTEDDLVYLGGDADDKDLIEVIIENCFDDYGHGEFRDSSSIENANSLGAEEIKDIKNMFKFYDIVLNWTENKQGWKVYHQLLKLGYK